MKLADVVRALLRRWYLTLSGLLVTAGLCAAMLLAIGPTYEDKASVLLLPPQSSLSDGENPYLGLSGLQQMVDVLVRSMNAQAVQLDAQSRWPSAEYSVQQDPETSAPVILITVDDRSEVDTRALSSYLVETLPKNLDKLQTDQGVRDRSRITSTVLTQYEKPEPVTSSQIRLGLAVAAAGLAGTALAVGLLDAVLMSRRRQTKVQVLSADDDQEPAAEQPALVLPAAAAPTPSAPTPSAPTPSAPTAGGQSRESRSSVGRKAGAGTRSASASLASDAERRPQGSVGLSWPPSRTAPKQVNQQITDRRSVDAKQ